MLGQKYEEACHLRRNDGKLPTAAPTLSKWRCPLMRFVNEKRANIAQGDWAQEEPVLNEFASTTVKASEPPTLTF
jgi:hypothetical protein